MDRRKRSGITIAGVKPGSLACSLNILPGDCLLAVNGVIPRDLLEYRYLTSGERVKLKIRRRNGEVEQLVIAKNYDADLGLVFPTDCFDGVRRCRNRCIFCFVDQLPPGMRPSLYEKDDDYRLSFLHGNFITLTNLESCDLQRILTFHLSPLYLSVHTTDPVLRGKMLGRREPAPVLDQLAALAGGGITMHIQIVLCPGINDGENLKRTIRELAEFWPQANSIGIVPVGLTKFRKKLPFLRAFAKPECIKLIKQITAAQKFFRRKFGSSFVYLADEFYLRANLPFPPHAFYDDFPQLENGIGLSRLFYEEFARCLPFLPGRLHRPRRFLIATGVAGAKVLHPLIARLNLIRNLDIKLVPIPNTFFGPRINVAGLLTGRDLLWGLRGLEGERVLLPRVLLRQGSSLLLDGSTIGEVASKLGCRLQVIEPTARALLEAVLGGSSRFFGEQVVRKGWENRL